MARARRGLLVVAVAALVLGAPRSARADFEFQFAAGVNARWLRATPALTMPPVSTSARELEQGQVPMRSGMTLLGPYVDMGLTIDDRFVVPILGGAYYGVLGSYDAVITSRDGSIVRARPWTADGVEVLLPGVGYRVKKRRWMFGANIRTGAGLVSMEGVVAAGAETELVDLTKATFILQAELEGCRRLDPTTRVCLQVAPRIYDHALLNGATFGLRVEWGR